jgi:integrase
MIPLSILNSGVVRMTKRKVTNKSAVQLPPGKHLTSTKGLYLYVSPDAQIRRWFFRFTSPETKRVTETGLGPFPAVSLEQAHIKAGDMRKQIYNGKCPIHAKRREKDSKITFAQAAEAWIAVRKTEWRSKSAEYSARLFLFNHAHALANKPVAQITTEMVESALKKLWAKHPEQGRRTLAMMERVFDFARAKKLRTGDNPARWRGLLEHLFSRRNELDCKGHAALPHAQMPEFMKVLRQKQGSSTAASALEFLILTAARTGEVTGMTWNEVENGNWVLPPDRTKQGREHAVPLPERAIAILEQQKQSRNGSPYVFNCFGREKLSDTTMSSLLRNMDVKATVHGFRATFRTWAHAVPRFPWENIEECLGHALGNSAQRPYIRSEAVEKQRAVLEAWAEYCGGGSPEQAKKAA